MKYQQSKNNKTQSRTPSQRLRAVLYRLWEIEKQPGEDFDKYYKRKMEEIINWVKRKLP